MNVRIEYSSQPGWISGPPALLIHQNYDEQDGTLQTPRSLTLVTVDEAIPGQLTLSAAIPVASDNIGADLHSGEGGSLVTIGSKIHIVFAVRNPTSGTDEFVATYNKTTRAFETGQRTVTYPGNPLNAPRVLLATMPNADGSYVADDHDQPAIGRDSQNYLHVVLGGHHVDFKYLKSLAANSSTSGWSMPVLVGVQSGGANYNEYSYPSLTFDQYDNLYVAARWMDGSYTARLVVMKKAAASSAFSPLTTLVTASRPGYGVWYHKMSVDPWSRLWLSYEYMPDYLSTTGNPSELSQYAALLSVSYGRAVTLTPEICGAPPCADDGLLPLPAAALVSNDLGATWRLATTYDFY